MVIFPISDFIIFLFYLKKKFFHKNPNNKMEIRKNNHSLWRVTQDLSNDNFMTKFRFFMIFLTTILIFFFFFKSGSKYKYL